MRLELPAGPGVRVDTGVAEGDTIPPDFDSMIAKIIAVGRTRAEALARLRRAMREKGVPDRCDTCGLGPVWQGRPLTLVVEHRNGDWLDNRISNLALLCPNCHSQTATWCRRKIPGS